MQIFTASDCRLHVTQQHPECAERLSFPKIHNEITGPYDPAILQLVHTEEHISMVKEACAHGRSLDADTQTSPQSFQAVLAAAATAMEASQNHGFALVRPPGHHAYAFKSTGFCLFNVIAIAVQNLVNQGKRVMILDFDGHLGDGTSDIFYEQNQVLFCSLHQYPAFPGNGWVNEIGRNQGQGYTINIPMPPGAADDLFTRAIKFLEPYALSFKPDVVAVSAGFDGHSLDPLLQLNYSLNSFYDCGGWLSQNFERVFAVLEGGYNLEVLPKAIEQFVAGVNRSRPPFQEEATQSSPTVTAKFEEHLELLNQNLKPFW